MTLEEKYGYRDELVFSKNINLNEKRRMYYEKPINLDYSAVDTIPYKLSVNGDNVEFDNLSWSKLLYSLSIYLMNKYNSTNDFVLDFRKDWSSQKLFSNSEVINSIKIRDGLWFHNTTDAQQSKKTLVALLEYFNIDLNNVELGIRKSYYKENKELLKELEETRKKKFYNFLIKKYDKPTAETMIRKFLSYDSFIKKIAPLSDEKSNIKMLQETQFKGSFKGVSIFTFDRLDYVYKTITVALNIMKNFNVKIDENEYRSIFQDFYDFYRLNCN